MLILVEVNESTNCRVALSRYFSTLGEPRSVTRVQTAGPDGQERVYEVAGWSANGPTAAYAVLVEDSGEGLALLVYGAAEEGMRLRPVGSTEPWSLDSTQQWGEACLLLAHNALVE